MAVSSIACYVLAHVVAYGATKLPSYVYAYFQTHVSPNIKMAGKRMRCKPEKDV